jgi:hypothetical protein
VLQRLRVMGKGLWVQAGGVKRLPNGDDERLRGMVGARADQAKQSGPTASATLAQTIQNNADKHCLAPDVVAEVCNHSPSLQVSLMPSFLPSFLISGPVAPQD